MSEYLRIGDVIMLKCFDSYLSAEGIFIEDVVVDDNSVEFGANLFKVFYQWQYSAAKELEEYIKLHGEKNVKHDHNYYKALKRGQENERKLNMDFMTQKQCEEVLFGHTIQLLHLQSGKFLTVLPFQTSKFERENIRLGLSAAGSTYSWIQILPRYKINRNGDRILNRTEVLLKVAERSNEYIHCSNNSNFEKSLTYREVNCSLEKSSWQINMFLSSQDAINKKLLLAGQLVYIREPESLSCLEIVPKSMKSKSETGMNTNSMRDIISNQMITNEEKKVPIVMTQDSVYDSLSCNENDVILRSCVVSAEDTNILWMIETDTFNIGGPLRNSTGRIRFKHLNTGMYLNMHATDTDASKDVGYELSTTLDSKDSSTVFSLREVHPNDEYIQNSSPILMFGSPNSTDEIVYVTRGVEINENINQRYYRKCKGNKMFYCNGTKIFEKATAFILTKHEPIEGGNASHHINIAAIDHISSDLVVCIFARNYIIKLCDSVVLPSATSTMTSIWPTKDRNDELIVFDVLGKLLRYLKGKSLSMVPPKKTLVGDTHASFKEELDRSVVIRRLDMARQQGLLNALLNLLHILAPVSHKCRFFAEGTVQYGDVSSSEATVACYKMGYSLTNIILDIILCAVIGHEQNQSYIAASLHIILEHVCAQPKAITIITEIISNHSGLQNNFLGPKQIILFVEQMQRQTGMNSTYLYLLKACCSIEQRGVEVNQNIILNALLCKDGFFCRFLTDTIDAVAAGVESPNLLNHLQPLAQIYLPANIALGDRDNTNGSESLENKSCIDAAFDISHHSFFRIMPAVLVSWVSSDAGYSSESLFSKPTVKIQQLFTGSSLLPSVEHDHDHRNVRVPAAKDKKKTVVEYLIAQLYLAAELCLSNNTNAKQIFEKLYPYNVLLSILLSTVSDDLKGAVISLIHILYVDQNIVFYDVLSPCLSIAFSNGRRNNNELSPGNMNSNNSEYRRDVTFGLLQILLSNIFHQLITSTSLWASTQSYQAAKLVIKLISLGCYNTLVKQIDVSVVVLKALSAHRKMVNSVSNNNNTSTNIVGLHRQQSALVTHSLRQAASLLSAQSYSMRSFFDESKTGLSHSGDFSIDKPKTSLPVPDKAIKVLWQKQLLDWLQSFRVMMVVLFIVLVSVAITIYEEVTSAAGTAFDVVEYAIFVIFATDLMTRSYCHRVVHRTLTTFVTDPFNIIDVTVVTVDAIVIVVSFLSDFGGNFASALRVARLVRLIRILRAARVINNLINTNVVQNDSWVVPIRYRDTPDTEIKTMFEMMTIIKSVLDLHLLHNYDRIISQFELWCDVNNKKNISELFQDLFNNSIADMNTAIHSNSNNNNNELLPQLVDLTNIAIDLIMYVDDRLVTVGLDAIISYHTYVKRLQSSVLNMQLLFDPVRQQQLSTCREYVEKFKLIAVMNYKGVTMIESEVSNLRNIFQSLTSMLRVNNHIIDFGDTNSADSTIQIILYNMNFFETAINMLKQLLQPFQNELHLEVIEQIIPYLFETLSYFILGNEKYQFLAFNYLDLFFDYLIFPSSQAHKLIKAIFHNNYDLKLKCSHYYIHESLDVICRYGCHHSYLAILSAITASKTHANNHAQFEIIRNCTAPHIASSVFVYLVPVSSSRYQEKKQIMATCRRDIGLDADSLPRELGYHIELLDLLASCVSGVKATTVEAKVQSIYPYYHVLDALLDPESLLVVKVHLANYLLHTSLSVTILLSSLRDDERMWRFLQEIAAEVLPSGFSALKRLRKTDSEDISFYRQQVEYVLVSVKCVTEFFNRYYITNTSTASTSKDAPISSAKKPLQHQDMGGLRKDEIEKLIESLFKHIKHIKELESEYIIPLHVEDLDNALHTLAKSTKTDLYFLTGYTLESIKSNQSLANNNTNDDNNNNNSNNSNNAVRVRDINGKEHNLNDYDVPQRFRMFQETIASDTCIQNLVKNEFRDWVRSFVEIIPLVADTSVQSDVRLEPFIQKLIIHIRLHLSTVIDGEEVEKKVDSPSLSRTLWILETLRAMLENSWKGATFEDIYGCKVNRNVGSGHMNTVGGFVFNDEDRRKTDMLLDVYAEAGVIELCCDLFSKGIDEALIISALKLCLAMLVKDGGNKVSQERFYEYLSLPQSAPFFVCVRAGLQKLQMWRTNRSVTQDNVAQITKRDGADTHEGITCVGIPDEILFVHLIHALCAGHYSANQILIKEQSMNNYSINLIDDLVSILNKLSKSSGEEVSAAFLVCASACLQLVQGPCERNQVYMIFNTELLEAINRQLRAKSSTDSEPSIREFQVKLSCVKLLRGLMEGQDQSKSIYECLLNVLHIDVIVTYVNGIDGLIGNHRPSAVSQLRKYLYSDDNSKRSSGKINNITPRPPLQIQSTDKTKELTKLHANLQFESKLLLRTLLDYVEKNSELKKQSHFMIDLDSFGANVASVEVMWKGQIHQRFFHIPEVCHNLSDFTKAQFIETVDRTSQDEKLTGLMTSAKYMYLEVRHQQMLKNLGISAIFSRRNQGIATWVSFLLALSINAIMLSFYTYECPLVAEPSAAGGERHYERSLITSFNESFFEPGNSTESEVEHEHECPSSPTIISSSTRSVVQGLNSLQIIFSAFTLLLFIIVRIPVNFKIHKVQGHSDIIAWVKTLMDPLTLYYFVYLVFAAIGENVLFLLTFLILDIVVKNSTARDVIKAVVYPSKALLMSFLLMAILMYIYAVLLVRIC